MRVREVVALALTEGKKMCCCGKAIINGESGYSWDGKSFSVRKPYFAELEEGDELIKDLPGRCGGIDSHSHDMRLVKKRILGLYLYVRHGGGVERIALHAYGSEAFLTSMAENDLYWLMRMVHGVQRDAGTREADRVAAQWKKAAVEKRIKTRKQRGSDMVRVWIESPFIMA